MSADDISKMNFRELRNEVQYLRDELAKMSRKYEDILYNLDDDNFSGKLIKEKNNMKTEITQTEEQITLQSSYIQDNKTQISALSVRADEISAKVEENYTDLDGKITNTAAQISITANSITSTVAATYETKSDAGTKYNNLTSKITQSEIEISAIVAGEYTENMLDNYFTGIEITPHKIKMMDDNVYSVYNSEGLKFYDSSDQVEGWAIEPDKDYGGVLRYYLNNTNVYSIGQGFTHSDNKYSTSDMVVKAMHPSGARFVVDVTLSGYNEVKFIGLTENTNGVPFIYANEKLIATQEWVENGITPKFA